MPVTRVPVTRRLLLLLTALVLGLVATAAPAAAHDQLESSEPTADATLVEVPPRVLLTFSAEVTDAAPTLVVRDAGGAPVTSALPVVDGDTVALPLPETVPNGDYTVEWAIVSGDGDPVSGEFGFTVEAPVTAVPTEATDAPATRSPAGAAPGTAAADPAAEDDDSAGGLWLAIGAAVLAVGAGAAAVLARRRRS